MGAGILSAIPQGRIQEAGWAPRVPRTSRRCVSGCVRFRRRSVAIRQVLWPVGVSTIAGSVTAEAVVGILPASDTN